MNQFSCHLFWIIPPNLFLSERTCCDQSVKPKILKSDFSFPPKWDNGKQVYYGNLVVCYCGGPAERSYRISLRVCDNEYNNCAFTCPTSESIQDKFFEFYESRSFLVAIRQDDRLFRIPSPRNKGNKGGHFFRGENTLRHSNVKEKRGRSDTRSSNKSEATQNLIYFVTCLATGYTIFSSKTRGD